MTDEVDDEVRAAVSPISAPVARPTTVLRLGTRRSALAMAQAKLIADALRAGGSEVELVGVTTDGDRSTGPLTESGGTGVFVTNLRARLLDGGVDIVVHSLKDLPTQPADDLEVAAVPLRADPRDALVARDRLTLSTLPVGASVGTGSPRRAAQLLAVRPDLDIQPLRGNVDTRVGRVGGEAGRASTRSWSPLPVLLGSVASDEATELLDPDVMLPAPGQGALAIECRAADVEPGGRLGDLLHRWTTRRAGRRSSPSEPCSRRSRRDVRPLSGHLPRLTWRSICIWSPRSSALTA